MVVDNFGFDCCDWGCCEDWVWEEEEEKEVVARKLAKIMLLRNQHSA